MAAVLLVGAAAPAGAHQPWFNVEGSPDPERPYRLPTPLAVSQVVYGGLAAPDRIDYYAFTAPAGFALDAYLVVPDTPACARFRPAMVVIGPGLTESERTPSTADAPLPAGLPSPAAGSGAVVIAGEEWEPFFETYTGTTFLVGPALRQRLAGGDYLVAVFDPAGGTGSYGLSVDGAELPGGDTDVSARFAAWGRCVTHPVPAATPEDAP